MVNEKDNKSHYYDYIVSISWVSMALEFLLPFPLMYMSGEMLTERMALCSHDQGWSLLVTAHCEEDRSCAEILFLSPDSSQNKQFM